MKRFIYFLIAIVILIAIVCLTAFICRGSCRLPGRQFPVKIQQKQDLSLQEGLDLLKIRKDADALVIFENLLVSQPGNTDALWGKAEVLRRRRDYKDSEGILNEILKKSPDHSSSITSLAYIRYKEDRLDEALELINRILKKGYLDKENRALCYLMLGAINSRRSETGGLFSKLRFGTHIRGYFLKAEKIAPDLPEVHLGLGAFYLLAPAIAGGDSDRALKELTIALKLAPDFATVNARLAQYYKKEGIPEQFDFYVKRAQELDPENEVLKELK